VHSAADDTDLPICTYHPARPDPARIRHRPAFVPSGSLQGRFDVHPIATTLMETLSTRWFYGGALDRVTARAVLMELLLVLLAPVAAEASKPRETSIRDLAFEVKQALDDNSLAADDSIQEFLQRRIGLSYAHVCRIFRKTFGVPPIHYLNTVRIERSKLMLADPRHDVAMVARAVGFSDPGYFSRLFRRQVGVSPRRYTRLTQ
jgi:AraC-like DNA-binding protein